jgi:hypothetical protein
MSARIVALCCLAALDASLGSAGPNRLSDPDLVVYLTTDTPQPSEPLQQMQQELTALMFSAGYRLEWRSGADAPAETNARFLVLIELHGYCGVGSGEAATEPQDAAASLAYSYVSGGRVLPFSTVNCGNLTRVIAPGLTGTPQFRRDYLYGRAVARLLAHELYHILANTVGHGREGIAQSAFSARNLLADSFSFAPAALSQLEGSATRGSR